jgi:hypothetical protein
MHNFLHQNVNRWLCIALLCLMCFWVVLYYFGHKAQDFGEELVANASALEN